MNMTIWIAFFVFSTLNQVLGVLGQTDEQIVTYSIASTVLVVYIIIDIVLVGILLWCCYCRKQTRFSKDPSEGYDIRSLEYIEGPVVLKITKKRHSLGSESSSIEAEHTFTDNNEDKNSFDKHVPLQTIEEPVITGEDKHDGEDVFEEKHFTTPEHQKSKHFVGDHKKHRNSAVRKDSQTFLLGAEEKSDEDDTTSPIKLTPEMESPIKLVLPDKFEAPEPHLVSIASNLTGPIIPNNTGPINDIPREIRSLDLSNISEIRKDSSVHEETSFNTRSSFVNHEKTGSDHINGGIGTPPSSGYNLGVPPTSDYNLNTISGTSLGYSEVEKAIQKISVDVDTIVRQSPNHGNHSFQGTPSNHSLQGTPGNHSYQGTPGNHSFQGTPGNHSFQGTPGNNFHFGSPVHLGNHTHRGNHAHQYSEPILDVSSLPHYSSLDLGFQSHDDQRSLSLSMTHSHLQSTITAHRTSAFRERNMNRSQSASNTPTHKIKFNYDN